MISNRTKTLKASPTLALAARAKELQSKGKDIVSLSVGEPDWPTLDVAAKAGIKAVEAGFTKYTPANGILELREAIATQLSVDIGLAYSAAQVTVTAGAKFVIFSALQSLVNPGDEVLIPSPYWVSYPTMVELADGVPVFVEGQAQNRFCVTGSELAAKITPKTKLLMLNSPSNPTGEIYSRAELLQLAEVLRKHPQIAILSDDIYNRLVFGDSPLAPHILQVAPDLAPRTVMVNGGSKSYSMTGWRIGWAIGPDAVIKAMTNYQSQALGCAASFTQKAACAAVLEGGPEVARANKELQSRRDYAVERLKATPGVKVASPGGAFYVWPDISGWMGKQYKGQALKTSAEVSNILLDDYSVAVVPGIEFGMEGYLRLSFALDQASMKKAFDRVLEFATQLK
jgi:aspartate aminotransferase